MATVRAALGRELMLDARRFRLLLTAALAVPGVVVALITGASGFSAWLFDRPLVLAPMPRNLSEAAGNRDVADVVVMSQAADMNERELARIPLRLRESAMLTPLEAAVISERAYMIRLVRELGAHLDARELRTLRCIAEARRDRGTIAYLAQFDASALNCDDVRIPK
jgi:hypothetical protein